MARPPRGRFRGPQLTTAAETNWRPGMARPPRGRFRDGPGAPRSGGHRQRCPRAIRSRPRHAGSAGDGGYGVRDRGRIRRDRGARSPAGAGAARGNSTRRAGTRHRPRRQARRRAASGRRPRRAGVRGRSRHRRLHPAGAERGRPGQRADRGVDPVQRGERLRRRPHVGLGAAERVGGERDAARHAAAPRERHVLGGLRHVQRPPQRHRVLHESARRARRLPDHQRGQSQRRLEPRMGRAHGTLRGRLDRRDGDSLQVDALPAGTDARLGNPVPPHGAPQERTLLPHPGAHFGRPARPVPRIRRRHARGPGGARRGQRPRSQAVRHRRVHDRRQRPSPRRRGTATAAWTSSTASPRT